MNTPTLKSMNPWLFPAGIAAIVFSAVAMASEPVTSWFQAALDSRRIVEDEPLPDIPAPLQAGAAASVNASYVQSVVVQSMRRVAPVGDAPEIYEITIHLRDGSTRTLRDAKPARWRAGDRMILIAGASSPGP